MSLMTDGGGRMLSERSVQPTALPPHYRDHELPDHIMDKSEKGRTTPPLPHPGLNGRNGFFLWTRPLSHPGSSQPG